MKGIKLLSPGFNSMLIAYYTVISLLPSLSSIVYNAWFLMLMSTDGLQARQHFLLGVGKHFIPRFSFAHNLILSFNTTTLKVNKSICFEDLTNGNNTCSYS